MMVKSRNEDKWNEGKLQSFYLPSPTKASR